MTLILWHYFFSMKEYQSCSKHYPHPCTKFSAPPQELTNND